MRSSAAQALKKLNIGRFIPDLITDLTASNCFLRQGAANMLGIMGAESAIPSLIALLQDTDYNVRLSAIYSLGIIGAKSAIPTLIDRLRSVITMTRTSPGNNAINTKGDVSMSTGPEKTVTNTPYFHQTVLSALTIVSDGANWQYDQSSWWRWYAEKFAKTNLDLRRDE